MHKVAITLGDPAGIGPELITKISKEFSGNYSYIIYGEEKTIKEAQKITGVYFEYKKIESVEEIKQNGIYLIDLNILKTPVPEPSVSSGKTAVAYLARAVADAVKGNVQAILTMPINKFWAKKAGFQFNGQTEYLAKASSTKEYAMMLYSEKIKVVLLSTHVPIREVPKYVKKEEVKKKVKLIHKEYKKLFGKIPEIKVLGLNPHAGENGEIGDEEIKHISPAVKELKKEGLKVEGPLPPDTAFIYRSEDTVFLCMYHDQGLIPFKLLAFEKGVNITLGLPFVRTSPDHGTAYDISWKNKADPSSSFEALRLIKKILDRGHV